MSHKSSAKPRPTDSSEGLDGAGFLLGLAAMSMGAILWELLLTRIYSVVLYYHFAFMAVSVAMFGLTLGAVLSHVRPKQDLAALAFWTGALMAASIAAQLARPLQFQGREAPTGYLISTYALSALPFVPAGAFICAALTRCRAVGAAYAADLFGAAAGCALMPPMIALFGGPGAAVAAGAACCLAAVATAPQRPRLRTAAAVAFVALTALAVVNRERQWLRVRFGHGGPMRPALHESWNAFSRIAIMPLPVRQLFGWGLDPQAAARFKPVEQLYLVIDSGAATPITRFDGDAATVQHLRYDLTAFVHRLRSDADVLVIGAGGGRDVLTAVVSGQRSVTAVEVNPDIVRAVNGVFGDFSGHLDRLPNVRFVVDEGRSYVARQHKAFDVIQVSFIDTVAATAAGAYAFVENGLYTTQAWSMFLSKLKPGGLLTFSRFYYGSTTWPVEVYRTLALAAAALRTRGVAEPRHHLLLLRTRQAASSEAVATILVGVDPISERDARRAEQECAEVFCEVAYGGGKSLDPAFDFIVSQTDSAALDRAFPLDIRAPSDNRPYFFFHARLGDVLSGKQIKAYGGSAFNTPAVKILARLAGIASALGLLLALIPVLWLRWLGRWTPVAQPALPPLYFAAIGLAFMFVEIGLMQQLSLFLGHPVYGFTVALFGLLALSGLGSWRFERLDPSRRGWAVLVCLAAAVAAVDAAAALVLPRAAALATPARLALALALIAPAAFFMGMAFPLGIDRARSLGDDRAPWYWTINGAFSVIGSVLAMLSCLALGIRQTIWIGAAIYASAAVVLAAMRHESSP